MRSQLMPPIDGLEWSVECMKIPLGGTVANRHLKRQLAAGPPCIGSAGILLALDLEAKPGANTVGLWFWGGDDAGDHLHGDVASVDWRGLCVGRHLVFRR